MAISNYTTKINPINTIAEIQKILVKHNASKVMTEYSSGIPVSVTFEVVVSGSPILYELPANWQGVLTALQRDSSITKKFKTEEQAIRVSWRILRDWIEAQMAIVEAELASMDQVMLPYAKLKSGKTVYQEFKTNQKLLT